jgi:hypothetical protein
MGEAPFLGKSHGGRLPIARKPPNDVRGWGAIFGRAKDFIGLSSFAIVSSKADKSEKAFERFFYYYMKLPFKPAFVLLRVPSWITSFLAALDLPRLTR